MSVDFVFGEVTTTLDWWLFLSMPKIVQKDKLRLMWSFTSKEIINQQNCATKIKETNRNLVTRKKSQLETRGQQLESTIYYGRQSRATSFVTSVGSTNDYNTKYWELTLPILSQS